jgi:hypothetical protein
MGKFDQAFSAVIEDLSERKMLDDVLVIAMSEFGRTPRINGHLGRDHWPEAWSLAMAGAGLKKEFFQERRTPRERGWKVRNTISVIYFTHGSKRSESTPKRLITIMLVNRCRSHTMNAALSKRYWREHSAKVSRRVMHDVGELPCHANGGVAAYYMEPS